MTTIDPITKRCPWRSHCPVDCTPGGPVPQVLECICWAEHLEKEALADEQQNNPDIEYKFD